MSHRGEGSVYREKTPPDKQMPGPPGSGKPVIVPPSQAMPDPLRMRAEQPPPPPPPLPGSGFGEGAAMPTQSEMAKKMADAQDTHSLAAHKIVGRLRATLTNIANLAESAIRHCWSKDNHYPWPDRHWQVHGGTLGSDEVAGRALCGPRDESWHGAVLAAKTESHHFARRRGPEETWNGGSCSGRIPCVQE